VLDLKTVAERVSRPEVEVLEQSLRAYLVREIGLIEAELAHYRERYAVVTVDDLRRKIAQGRVAAHPAWEDMIEWQNGLDAIQDLVDLLETAGA
jgi:hypothetical protein